jgi:hypothetical protein
MYIPEIHDILWFWYELLYTNTMTDWKFMRRGFHECY